MYVPMTWTSLGKTNSRLLQYTTRYPSGEIIIYNYHNLQTTNFVNTSISNGNDNTVFIDLGCCMILKSCKKNCRRQRLTVTATVSHGQNNEVECKQASIALTSTMEESMPRQQQSTNTRRPKLTEDKVLLIEPQTTMIIAIVQAVRFIANKLCHDKRSIAVLWRQQLHPWGPRTTTWW